MYMTSTFRQAVYCLATTVGLFGIIETVNGLVTQIGTVPVDNQGGDGRMVENSFIISFSDNCYSGTTSQDRANELLSTFSCIAPLSTAQQMNGFITFSTDINSYLIVEIIDSSCLDTTTDHDLSHLCIDKITNDFEFDIAEETRLQTQDCINVNVFPNGPLPYSYSLDSFDTFDNSFESYFGNSEMVDAYVVDFDGIITEHEDFFKVENLFLPDPNGPTYNQFALLGDHGTMCASLIVGINYGSAVSNQIIYNVFVRATTANIIAGLFAVNENLLNRGKVGVVSMSFIGYGIPQSGSDMIDNALKQIIQNGGIPVAAAGNERWDVCINGGIPASFDSTINVGSHDINYNVAATSNYGECVDIYGPGVNVVGAVGTLNEQGNGLINGNEYGTKSGTSFSTPYIAGIIVNWLAECEKTGFHQPCTFDNIKERLSDWSVTINPLRNTDQCGNTGVPCEAAQYFCGRPFWPRETNKCVWSPCAEFEAGNCQVYNEGSGCSQCEGNSFKISDNYPCKRCNDILGPACLFCQDYQGCGQCIDNNNYYLITDGNTGLRYCSPQPCLNAANNCLVCNNGFCSQCRDGFRLNPDGKSCNYINWDQE